MAERPFSRKLVHKIPLSLFENTGPIVGAASERLIIGDQYEDWVFGRSPAEIKRADALLKRKTR
jgi:hypothetical protein